VSRSRLLRWLGLGLWCAVLLLLSVSRFASLNAWIRAQGAAHYGVHVGVFALGALLICRANVRLTSLACLLGFGAILEGLEALRYETQFEYSDVIADAAGLLLYVILFRLSRKTPAHGIREAD
jgi:hypothetical protein